MYQPLSLSLTFDFGSLLQKTHSDLGLTADPRWSALKIAFYFISESVKLRSVF